MIRITQTIVLLALALVLVLPVLAVQETKMEGKIKSITADKNQFVLTGKDDAKDHKFQLDLKAKIELNNKISKLDDLKTGDEVTVTYKKESGKLMATNIQCRRK